MAVRLGLWARLWRSAWSADAYRDAATGRVGRMVGSLAVLITIATALVTIRAHVTLVRALEDAKPWVKAHIPEIQITKGTASSPAAQARTPPAYRYTRTGRQAEGSPAPYPRRSYPRRPSSGG